MTLRALVDSERQMCFRCNTASSRNIHGTNTHTYAIYICNIRTITWCASNQRNQRARSLLYPHWQKATNTDSICLRNRLICFLGVLLAGNIVNCSLAHTHTHNSNFQQLWGVRPRLCLHPHMMAKWKTCKFCICMVPRTMIGNQRLRSCFMQKYYNFMNLSVNQSPSTLSHQHTDNRMHAQCTHVAIASDFVEGCDKKSEEETFHSCYHCTLNLLEQID